MCWLHWYLDRSYIIWSMFYDAIRFSLLFRKYFSLFSVFTCAFRLRVIFYYIHNFYWRYYNVNRTELRLVHHTVGLIRKKPRQNYIFKYVIIVQISDKIFYWHNLKSKINTFTAYTALKFSCQTCLFFSLLTEII